MIQAKQLNTSGGKNRFKFQSFAEQIRNIDVDVIHSIRNKQFKMEIKENDSYFHEALLQWSELNCTLHFTEFYRKILPYVSTFNQVLLNQKKIVEILIEHLKVENSMALEPLIKDGLEPIVIEGIFHCIGFMVKYLRKKLCQDIEKTFDIVSPLLLEPPHKNIKYFAAPSLAYLFRKLDNDQMERIVHHVFKASENNLEYQKSLAMLFFETLKGPQTTFYSKSDQIFTILIQYTNESVQFLMEKFLALVCFHGDYTTLTPFLGQILEKLETGAEIWFSLLEVFLLSRKSSKVKNISLVISKLCNLDLEIIKQPICLRVFASVVNFREECEEKRKLAEMVFKLSVREQIYFCYLLHELHYESFSMAIVPHLVQQLNKSLGNDEEEKTLFVFFSYLLKNGLQSKYLHNISGQVYERLLEYFNNFKDTHENFTLTNENEKMPEFVIISHLLSFFEIIPLKSTISETFMKVLFDIFQRVSASEEQNFYSISFISQLVHIINTKFADALSESYKQMLLIHLTSKIQAYPSHIVLLDSFFEFIHIHKPQIETSLLFSYLKENLKSPIPTIREKSLRILIELFPSSSEEVSEPKTFFRLLHKIEQIGESVQSSREKTLLIKKLETNCIQSRKFPRQFVEAIPYYFLGLLTSNFKPVWEDASRVLIGCHSILGKEKLWPIIYRDLKNYHSLDDVENNLYPIDTPTFDYFMIKSKETKEMPKDEFSDASLDRISLLSDKANNFMNEQYFNILFMEQCCSLLSYDHRFDQKKNHELLVKAIINHAPWMAEQQAQTDLVPIFFQLVENKKNSLLLLMELFSKFKDPKKHLSSEQLAQLENIYLQKLSSFDSTMQKMALDCLSTFKYDYITSSNEMLQSLIDEKTFRDTLTLLSVEKNNQQYSNEFLCIVIRILYGKMFAKSDSQQIKIRRKAILIFLSGCDETQLQYFMNLVFDAFSNVFNYKSHYLKGEFVINNEVLLMINEIPLRKQIGLLFQLESLHKQFAGGLKPFISNIFIVLLYLYSYSHGSLMKARAAEGDDEEPEEDLKDDFEDNEQFNLKYLKRIRNLSLKRLLDLFELNFNLNCIDFAPFLPSLFQTVINDRLLQFEHENLQAPSPLLQMFVLWSKQIETLPYLSVSEQLLPKVFACLSSKNVKAPVIQMILDLIENMIQIPNEEGMKVLIQNADCLLLHLQSQIQSQFSTSGELKDLLMRRQIFILSQMVPFAASGQQLKQLVDLLIPFLKRPRLSQSTKLDILNIFSAFANVHQQDLESYYRYFCQLLHTMTGRENRLALSQIFKQFAQHQPELVRVGDWISALNSYSIKRVDELDWDQIMKAIDTIHEQEHKTLSWDEWQPLVYQYFYYIDYSNESILQNQAADGLSLLIQQPQFADKVMRVVYPLTKKGIQSSSQESCRAVFIKILYQLVKLMPNEFPDLVCLLHENEEACFYHNIYHIQLHRRARALRKLAEKIQENCFRQSTMKNLLLPLVMHFILDEPTNNKTPDHHIIHESIECLGLIAQSFGWNWYLNLLKKYFRLLQRENKPAKYKVLIKALLSIVQNFHWDLKDVRSVVIHGSIEEEQNEEIEMEKEEEEDEQVEEIQEQKEDHKNIYDIVLKFILPQLYKLFANHKEGDSNLELRIPVAISYAKLLTHLDSLQMEKQVPRLFLTISHILKSQEYLVRQTARDTLVKICRILGQRFIYFCHKEMKTALHSGYQLHILSYSIHSLLSQLQPELEHGSLNSSVSLLMPVIIEDIFGTVAEEKEVAPIAAKMKETKTRKGLDILEIMSSLVSLESLERALIPLRDLTIERHGLKFSRVMEGIFLSITNGLLINSGLDMVSFCVFIFELMTESHFLFSLEEHKHIESETILTTDKFEENFTIQTQKRTLDQLRPKDFFVENQHLWVEFGYQMFYLSLKKAKLNPLLTAHFQIIESFFPVLRDTLQSSKNNKNILFALKSLHIILQNMPKDTLNNGKYDSLFTICLEKCLKFFSKTTSNAQPLAQTCMKMLSTLIQTRQNILLKENQVIYLINKIRADFSLPDRQNAAFTLVRALFSRKMVLPEFYDLADEILQVMITNQTDCIRLSARQTLLQFYLDFPMSSRKLLKLFSTLVSNLNYIYESGRESVLEFLNSILFKFPLKIICDYGQMIYLGLTVQLENDSSPKCRQLIEALLVQLLAKLPTDNLTEFIELSQTWADGADTLRVFYRSFAILAEALTQREETKKWFKEKYALVMMDKFLPFQSQAELLQLQITSYQKIIQSIPEFLKDDSHLSQVLPLLEKLLVHENQKVQLHSCRLIETLFSSPNVLEFFSADFGQGLKNLAGNHLQQLSNALDTDCLLEEHGNLIIKNLFTISKSMNDFLFLKLLKKISGLSTLEKWKKARKYLFKWLAAVIQYLPNESLTQHLTWILTPLYKVSIDETYKGKEGEALKELATDIMNRLETKVGGNTFFQTQSQIQQQINKTRMERKSKAKIQSITNPEARAKRKISKNLMKKNNRKRKVDESMKSKVVVSVKKLKQ